MRRYHPWRRSRRGFTLVELIVVIAILAILAGVAIPVYSGYIKKANAAADNQLLAAVNSAFAAACLENRFDAKYVTGAYLKADGNDPYKIAGVVIESVDETMVKLASESGTGYAQLGARTALLDIDYDALNQKVNSAFVNRYFAGNLNTKLKTVKVNGIAFAGGVFQIDKVLTVTVAGKTYTYTQTAVDTYTASNFNNAEVSELTGTVDMLSDALSDSKGGLAALVNNSPAFRSMLVDLGVITEDQVINNSMSNALADQIANASVLYVASSAESLSADTIYDTVKNGGDLGSLLTSAGFEAGVNTAFVNTAFKFALATAFVNSAYGADYKSDYDSSKGNITNLSTAADFYAQFSGLEEFEDYLNDAQAKKDIEGFMAALNVINENDGNFDMSGDYSAYNEVLYSILYPSGQ